LNIECSLGASPIVLGTAARLKRSAADPKLARRMEAMKGVLALKSSADKQSVTVRFDRGNITLAPGVASDAGLVITLDMNDPDAKPKVKGALTHLRFALAASKVLEPPPKTWQAEAQAFWAFASDWPRMPRSMRIVCTDDEAELHLGDPSTTDVEIAGSAKQLRSVFSGDSILTEDWLTGKLHGVSSLEHASILTGRSIAWVMGDGR
jgi:hypothetical protein